MKQNSLKVNMVLNGLKQCFGIIFPLITFPYVSRVLGEDGFGKYSFSWSIVSYFVVLAGLGISTYAIREGARIRDNRERLNIFCSEAFSINFITTIVSFCALIIVSIISIKIRNYLPFILIQSSALFLNLIGRDWINSIYEDYFYLTIRYLIIQVFSLILMFLLIKSSGDVWKYCLISIAASFGGNIPNLIYLRRYSKIRLVRRPNLKKHSPHLLVLFVTQISIMVYVNADITMLGFYANDSTVGIYSLASKIYSMIKTIVNAMVLVTLPHMTYIIENTPEKYYETLKKVSSYLVVILLPITCGVFMLSEEVILIVGGSSYQSGSYILKILSGAMIFAVLCSFCMNSILIAHRREKECLKATTISAIINVSLNLIALPLWGMMGAAITTIIAEAINFLLLLKASKKIVDLRSFDLKNLFQNIMACISIVMVCMIVHKLHLRTIFTFIISSTLSTICYFMALLMLKNVYVKEIYIMFKNKLFRGSQR